MQKSHILRSHAFIASFISAVRAFSVTVGTPTQCDDLAVSWSGGQAPFEIVVTPFNPSQELRNFSVPASAFSNGNGSYSIPQFPYKEATQFLLTMSDATGFGSGGTSTIQTVGAPVAKNNCNTTVLSPDFFFSTPLQLQQCNDYAFTGYDGATQPVTITGLIPGGEHVVLYPPTGPNYTWVADVEAGTSLIFFMIDSQGRQGGVSPLNTVQPLSNTSCINVNSPSSTASAPSQTSSQGTPSGSNTATVGIIAGAAVGGVVLLVLLIILGVFCIRKASRQSRRKDDDIPKTDDGSHLPLMHSHLSASDPFSRHLRQISFADSFVGSSSVSSDNRLMGAMGGQTASPNTFPHQTVPIVLAPPGTHSHLTNASTVKFPINNPHTSSSQPSRLSSNVDIFAGYGHARTLSHYASSDHPSPLPIQPSRLSSNIDSSAGHVDAGSSPGSSSSGRVTAAGQAATSPSAHIIVHTDIEDGPPPPDIQEVIELPPQYTDRQPLASQSASVPRQLPSAPREKLSRY